MQYIVINEIACTHRYKSNFYWNQNVCNTVWPFSILIEIKVYNKINS